MAENVTSLQLESKKQLVEAIDQEDDWTGLTDPAARRKRQNRLHQRAWRRKQALQAVPVLIFNDECQVRNLHTQAEYSGDFAIYQDSRTSNGHSSLNYTFEYSSQLPSSSNWSVAKQRPGDSISEESRATAVTNTRNPVKKPAPRSRLIPPILPYLDTNSYTFDFDANSVRFTFPLSIDQRLITLAQYNVLRATLTNMKIMSLLHTMPAECGASFSIATLPVPDNIPSALRPTTIQQAIPHESWIDCLPDAAMRDNLILNCGKFDQDDLCCDICGGLYEGFDDVQLRGILVWSDPWSPDGWEVTEGFAKKWTFLLRGCQALMDSTNRYRVSRHEERLIIEV